MASRPLADRLRLALPAAATLLLMLLFAAPLPSGIPLAPRALWLMGLLLPVAAPASWNAPLAFAFGLLADAIEGTPLGSQALLALLATLLAANQSRRLEHQPLRVRWAEAAATILVLECVLWAVTSWVLHTLLPLRGALLDALVTALWFPAFWLLAGWLASLLPSAGARG